MINARPEERKTWALHYRGINLVTAKKAKTNRTKSEFSSWPSNRCEGELVVFPNRFRAWSLQFSDDWQISLLGRSWKAEKRQDQRPLPAPPPPPPPLSLKELVIVSLLSYSFSPRIAVPWEFAFIDGSGMDSLFTGIDSVVLQQSPLSRY